MGTPTSAQGTAVAYRQWTTGADWSAGSFSGTRVDGEDLVLAAPQGTVVYDDPYRSGDRPQLCDVASWTSPPVRPGFGFVELVASWNAATPAGTWLHVEARVETDGGARSGWFGLGRWCAGEDGISRTSEPEQRDEVARVDVDTLIAADGRRLTAWQLRVTLHRRAGASATPRLSLLGAVASAAPGAAAPVSPPGAAVGVTLDLPAFSQQLHAGDFPQWDGGGEAWCSPTSTTMVLRYWGTGPTPADHSWVDSGHPDPWVDHAARGVYDHAYAGAGNWSFNVAYAAQFGLAAFVTRLGSLAEAERFVAAGLPLIISTSFAPEELTGAGYGTKGHLMVIVGFTRNGDVVVHDPASHLAADNAQVRTAYDRAELQRAWWRSGGTAYVIRPANVPLPSPSPGNW